MEADWEVEIGGDARVIDAHWPGFIDLHAAPERIREIQEARELPPLADLLLELNSAGSPIWTSKCDVWQLEPGAIACYVDLLPMEGTVYSEWKLAEAKCRTWIDRLVPRRPGSESFTDSHPILVEAGDPACEASITLVVRQAISRQVQGFGITAYFSADSSVLPGPTAALGRAMVAFSNAILQLDFQRGADRS
jgi:hypothetical protein